MPYFHGLFDHGLSDDQNDLLTPMKREKHKRRNSSSDESDTDCSTMESTSLVEPPKTENVVITKIIPEQDEDLEKRGKILDDLMKLECGAFRKKARESRFKYESKSKP